MQGASSIDAEILLTIRCPTHTLQKLYQFFPMFRSLATSKSLFMRDIEPTGWQNSQNLVLRPRLTFKKIPNTMDIFLVISISIS